MYKLFIYVMLLLMPCDIVCRRVPHFVSLVNLVNRSNTTLNKSTVSGFQLHSLSTSTTVQATGFIPNTSQRWLLIYVAFLLSNPSLFAIEGLLWCHITYLLKQYKAQLYTYIHTW